MSRKTAAAAAILSDDEALLKNHVPFIQRTSNLIWRGWRTCFLTSGSEVIFSFNQSEKFAAGAAIKFHSNNHLVSCWREKVKLRSSLRLTQSSVPWQAASSSQAEISDRWVRDALFLLSSPSQDHSCRHRSRPFLMQRHQSHVTRDRRQEQAPSLGRVFTMLLCRVTLPPPSPGCAEECSLITWGAMRHSSACSSLSRGAKSAIKRFSGFRCGPVKTNTGRLSCKHQRSQFYPILKFRFILDAVVWPAAHDYLRPADWYTSKVKKQCKSKADRNLMGLVHLRKMQLNMLSFLRLHKEHNETRHPNYEDFVEIADTAFKLVNK